MEPIITFVTLVAGFMTLIAGVVTIIWFVRDVRKQNSKELKNQSEILRKVDEGQRKGFETLARILDRIEKSSEATVKSLEVQTRILEKIEAK